MTTQLTQEQMQTLGIDTLAHSERDRFLQQVGTIVFESAIHRMLDTFSEEQMAAFVHAVDSYDSFDATLRHIQRTYPIFNGFLKEEQEQFVQKFVARLNPAKQT